MCEKIYDSKFSDLDTVTAYSLWQLRSRVFVVGQQLNVLDLDGRDLEPTTWHVWAAVDGDRCRISGCLRMLRGER